MSNQLESDFSLLCREAPIDRDFLLSLVVAVERVREGETGYASRELAEAAWWLKRIAERNDA